MTQKKCFETQFWRESNSLIYWFSEGQVSEFFSKSGLRTIRESYNTFENLAASQYVQFPSIHNTSYEFQSNSTSCFASQPQEVSSPVEYQGFPDEDLAENWEPVLFGYAGGLQDRDTGLIRFGARDYDPMVGRWTSKEPLGFNGSDNFYVYAGNDPVNKVDPDGNFVWIAAGAGVGAFVNMAATYYANNGNVTTEQMTAAFVSGAISGAIGTLAGPLGGTIAKMMGASSTGFIAIASSAVISGGGGYAGQVAANYIDPCNESDPLNAGLFAAIGGGIAKGAFPTKTLNTLKQAEYFQPTTVKGLFNSRNSSLFWGAGLTSSGVGAASNFGGPF